jgi:BASS family bile acid:Na+ symporter
MLKKILEFYTKYFAIWVVAFGVVAYFWPDFFLRLEKDIAWVFAVTIERVLPRLLRLEKGLNWFFALTMFGIGAVLRLEDFKRIVQKPVIILIGSAAQFSIMPLGAFLLAKLFGLQSEIAAGLILTGSAPGAMASNVMSYIAKADTAYSISLTTASTMLCPLLTPALTYILARRAGLEISLLGMILTAMKLIVVPVFIGFGVRYYLKSKIEKVLAVFPVISVTCIIFICSLVIAENKDRLGGATVVIFAAAVILNIYGMLAGYGVGSVFRMEARRRRTLAIEIGMQNAGLGTILARDHIGPEAAIPAAIFVFICIITASAMAAIWQRTTADLGRNLALDNEKEA